MERDIPEEIKDALSSRYSCYVLIACDDPTQNGQMNVEMSYSGDPVLATYLLHTAQSFIDVEDDGDAIPEAEDESKTISLME